jgi:ubiquinone/menaquinone biosynthesis C-methylase UbiE
MKTALLVIVMLCVSPVVTAVQRRDIQREATEIAQLLQLSETTVLADVGAGGGTWTFLLAPRVGHIFATDVKGPQVSGIENYVRSRGIANVSVILGTQEQTGLPSSCCDAMLLRLVYHAFRNPPMMRDSIRRALKTHARILIVDFEPTPEQLSEEMRTAGFEQLQMIARWQDQPGVYAVLFRKSE